MYFLLRLRRGVLRFITEELTQSGIVLDPEKAPVIKRCIHTSADFDYAQNLVFSENAIARAKEAIRNGASIVTDTQMGRSGINKKKTGSVRGTGVLLYV